MMARRSFCSGERGAFRIRFGKQARESSLSEMYSLSFGMVR